MRRRHRRTIIALCGTLFIAVAAVALVRTGHIGESQDLATAWADETAPSTAPDVTITRPDAPTPPPPNEPDTQTAPAEELDASATTGANAYWPRASGKGLVAAAVNVSVVAPLGGALAALAYDQGMPAAGRAVSQAGAIQAVQRRGDVAVVDFDPSFSDIYPVGSAEEIAMLAPVVYTATGFDGINQVLITVNGAPPATTGSFDLNEPLTRAHFPGLDR